VEDKMIQKVKNQVETVIKNAISQAISAGEFQQIDLPDQITIEVPKEKSYGDFSINIAMQLTKQLRNSPNKIADIILKNAKTEGTYIKEIQIAGPGFINFYLDNSWLYRILPIIQKEDNNYGKSEIGKGQKVMVEFVSANPTGPLHMGNARGGALGDCIASVLEAVGYEVTREFYINDAGNQIEIFAECLEARYIQLLKGEDAIEFPENGYKGEDLRESMREFIKENGDKYLEVSSEGRRRVFAEYGLKKNLDSIKAGLESYGVEFDVWFSEKSLHESGQVTETIELLKKNGYTYEDQDAVWFKAAEFGADKDVVLVRGNGIPTYFAADIAYHRNKFLVRGFDRVIDLLGADHHGHLARMKAGVAACGIDAKKLDIVIFQLVMLLRNGEAARMSKRSGKAISLVDLVEEVGRDAARFFFNAKQANTHLDFDLDLAVSQSNENPVYYIQYAHARICNMVKLIQDEGVRVPQTDKVNLNLLSSKEELNLIRKLADLPQEIEQAAKELEPSRLTRYLHELASLFHSFYNACKVKGEQEDIMKARLVLVDCVRVVIKNVLDMLKISAPERM
jgi:arginyl-tRNA synthetase